MAEPTGIEREIHPYNKLDPQRLITIWDKEKPWETPPSTPKSFKRVFKFGRSPQLPLRVRSYEVGDDGRNEYGQLVHVAEGKGKNEYDVRGWILNKLGVPDKAIKTSSMNEYEAQKLIAKGLGISRFHAAILDYATRSIPHDEIDTKFKDALLHPETFLPQNIIEESNYDALSQFATQLENLHAEEWDTMSEAGERDGWNTTDYYARSEELQRRDDVRDSIYVAAFRDVIRGAIRDTKGREASYDPKYMVLPLSVAVLLGMQEIDHKEVDQIFIGLKSETMDRAELSREAAELTE